MRTLYATLVRCDWPDCPNEIQVNFEAQLTDGWAFVPGGLNFDGRMLFDFCSIHARTSLAELAALVMVPK